MKFRAHDTFFIRKGWLSKGMRNVNNNPEVFIDREKNPTDVLGIGSNMVKALRYWMQAVGLTEEPKTGKRSQHFTKLGERIFKNDPYIEELGTLYLLQYRLASNKELATAWYFFFNEFSMTEFTKDNFIDSLKNYIRNEDMEVPADRSLSDDFSCIINTYRSKSSNKKISPEFNIDCPLGQIGLIDILNKDKKTYKKTAPIISTLNPFIILAVIVEQADGRKEINLNELLTKSKNIGRVFNLDTISMLDVLYQIEKLGLIKITRTAGLDVINIQTNLSPIECVDKYYETINK